MPESYVSVTNCLHGWTLKLNEALGKTSKWRVRNSCQPSGTFLHDAIELKNWWGPLNKMFAPPKLWCHGVKALFSGPSYGLYSIENPFQILFLKKKSLTW